MTEREVHSLGGLWVRQAWMVDKRIRLELAPSDDETRSFLRHIHKLDDTDGFEIEVEPEMLERIILPDEVGTREHKLAMLPGNCINLKVALDADMSFSLSMAPMTPPTSWPGDEKTGFRPTPKFSRLVREYVSDLSRAFVFRQVRGFFRDTGNGRLVPDDEKPGAQDPPEGHGAGF